MPPTTQPLEEVKANRGGQTWNSTRTLDPPKRFFRSLMANDIGRHVQADVSNPLTLEDSHEHLNGLGLHWGWVRQQLIWFGVKFRLFTS